MALDFLNSRRLAKVIAMGTDVEKNAPSRVMPQEDDLKNLEDAYAQLQDQAQNLINERSQMETDIRNLKKRAQRLDDEVRLLRAPPLIIGHLQDVLDDRTAIVRSSNGTVFQVSLNQRLEPKTRPSNEIPLAECGFGIRLAQSCYSLWPVSRHAFGPSYR